MKELLFSAQGRLARGGFWKGVLVSIGIAVVGYAIAIALLLLLPHEVDTDGSLGGPGAIVFYLCSFALMIVGFWIGLCLGIKRFHDREKSGWWVLIQLVPIIGPFWYLIEAGFLVGTPGPNRFGHDPLGMMPVSGATSMA